MLLVFGSGVGGFGFFRMSLRNLCLLFYSIWSLWSVKLWLDSFGDTIQHELVFCDVGQGDAILIRDGDFEIWWMAGQMIK